MSESVKRPRGRPRKNPLPEVNIEEYVREVAEDAGYDPDRAVEIARDIGKNHLKVHIYPSFGGEDQGDGGIRRVVEAQIVNLSKFGIQIVDTAEKADVIAYHATVPATYIKLHPRKAFVALCHGMYWSEYEEWENWALKANVDVMEGMRVADAIVAPSEWVANSIRRHLSRPVTVISHGINIEEFPPSEERYEYVLWNKTRPDPVCDPDPLNKLAASMPDIQFVSTFGDNIPNLKLTGRLPFENAKELVRHAGVYLCTTRETFGIGTLEAMAAGVPVVGFNFGGQAEFIEHGVEGWLARPGDIDGLVEGVRWAFANRTQVAAAARAKAATFTWENSCEKYAALFKETYANKNKPGPRTSIIVTTYNLEKYLPDCLNSVQNQSDQDWECIVIDDASPNTQGAAIAQTFADEDHRFKVIRNEKNAYLAEARNIGIRQAKGRYILPLDADDMLTTRAVEILADALDNDRSAYVTYGNVLFVEENGNTLSQYGENNTPGHSGWPFPFQHEYQIQQKNLLPYASMYRKEAWEYTGGYRRRSRTAEDAEFWTRLGSYGFRPRMVTKEDTLVYRNREGSMSRTNSVDWIRWFTWASNPDITPAGAVTREQLPIPSLDPVVISIIIPVGPGHDKLVQDAIDSVDAQTFRNWECVVINDTGKPLETELPAWVRLLSTEGKTGPAHARNIGIAASRGRLFLPLDADDYLEPEALRMMYSAYEASRDVIYSDFWQSDSEGKEFSLHECDDYDAHYITGGKRMVDGVARQGMIHSVTALTPKTIWERVGGYDESLSAWEDWDFQIAIANIGVCSRRVAAPLFFYRKHTGLRREENFALFEQSKQGILRKWGHLWKEGGKELMACSTCSGRRTVSPIAPLQARRATPPNNEAVLLRYIGDRQGGTPYRGPSKTVYWFSKNDVKYVLAADAPMFMSYGDFEVVSVASETPSGNAPVLVAEGPPNQS